MGSTQHTDSSESASPLNAIAWRRVVKWAFVIYVSVSLVAFLFGLSMAAWHLYGPTLEEAIETNRQIRTVAYWTVAALLYWRFAAPLSRRVLHVLAVLVVFESISALVLLFVFGDPVSELWDPWALGRSVVAATVGLALASLGSNNSSKPTPLRGAA